MEKDVLRRANRKTNIQKRNSCTFLMGISYKDKNKEVHSISKMETITKASIQAIYFMEKEYTNGKTVLNMMVSFFKIKSKDLVNGHLFHSQIQNYKPFISDSSRII